MTAALRTLLGEYSISRVIKGGWQLAGGHGPVDRARAVADMFAFADAGITTFDCADIYTGVEEIIGEFLAAFRARRGESDDVRVHTKFVPDLRALPTIGADDVARLVDRSRQRLQVDVLDLVQFHWWDYAVPRYVETALHLEALRCAGRIRQLGVTNFDTPRLAELLDAGIHVVSNQVQYSLLDRRPAGGMTSLCRARGVALLCYGALAGGFLSERWLGAPPPAEPLENRSLVKYRLVIEELGGWEHFQALLRLLESIGRRHDVTIGSVAIRWTLDQPGVAAVIAGARHASHLAHTLTALSMQLTDSDRGEIDVLLAQAGGPSGDVYDLERDREGAHGRIMRYDLSAPQPRPPLTS